MPAPMSATRTAPYGPYAGAGFTVIELVVVIVLLGLLTVVALPRLDGVLTLRSPAWRDQVLGTLRTAHSLAQGHRRLVCASVATGAVSLSIASTNPASACDTALPGGDGVSAYATESSGIATSVAPGGTVYFQPDGRITSDGAGVGALNASISVGGETAISLVGDTGHVE